MSYYQPDLTGSLPEYNVSGDVYTLFVTEQKITFNEPIFKSSLVITHLSAPFEPLIDGVDWEVRNEDIDYTAISRCKNQDNNFSDTLITGITITRNIVQEIKVTMSYQRLYPVAHKTALDHYGNLELTPNLINDMLVRLSNLESVYQPLGNTIAEPMREPRLLPLDPHKDNPNNVVKELHMVNVFDKQNYIKPTVGSFFRDSVQVRIPELDLTLKSPTEDEAGDYIVFGCNHAKTKISANESGVYDYILITYPYAGPIEITIHGYGGEVTTYDVDALNKTVTNLFNYLTDKSFVTPESIKTLSPIKMIYNRLIGLEDKMRVLLTQPTYGDTSSGTTYVRHLRTLDYNYHWFTIAKLYKVEGDDTITVADRCKFRIHATNIKLLADVTVSVDLRQASDPMTLDASGVINSMEYKLFDYVSPHAAIAPKFRVVYNDTALIEPSGIYLQIGLSLPALQETLVIEDISGLESCWLFLPQGGQPTLPEDNTFVLPDGGSVWDSANNNSIQVVKMLPTPEPYLAFYGSIPVIQPVDTDIFYNGNSRLDYNFHLNSVKEVELIFKNGEGLTFKSIAYMSSTDTGCVGTGVIKLDTSVVSYRVSLDYNPNGPLPIELTIKDLIITGNPLIGSDLRYVLVRV